MGDIKSWWNSMFFIELNTKVNVKYYYNVLVKKMILEMNRLAKHNEYLFMQDGARAHIAKFTLEILKDKKKLRLREHRIVQIYIQ